MGKDDLEYQSFEDYMLDHIKHGYLLEDGTPLKCFNCDCTELRESIVYTIEGLITEYSVYCTNKDCLKLVGNWSYGTWQI